jgi:sulfite reductase beta subunit-like hemoprotein
LQNKKSGYFSARVITENGVLDSGQIKILSEAADKFGNGH